MRERTNRDTKRLSSSCWAIARSLAASLQSKQLPLHGGSRGKGLPLSPAPQIPAQPKPSLRSGRFQSTMPNTSCTIITPASLRSDCCSFGFLRNRCSLSPECPLWRVDQLASALLGGKMPSPTTLRPQSFVSDIDNQLSRPIEMGALFQVPLQIPLFPGFSAPGKL